MGRGKQNRVLTLFHCRWIPTKNRSRVSGCRKRCNRVKQFPSSSGWGADSVCCRIGFCVLSAPSRRHLEPGLYFPWLQGKQRRNKEQHILSFWEAPFFKDFQRSKFPLTLATVCEKWTISLTTESGTKERMKDGKKRLWVFVKAEPDLLYLPPSFCFSVSGTPWDPAFRPRPCLAVSQLSLLTSLSNRLTFPIW